MRSKDSCPVWGEGAGKVPEGNSPTPYSTSRTVLGARGGDTPPRDSPSVPDDRRQEALALAGGRSGWGSARRSGPEPARQEGRQASAKRLLRKLLKRQTRVPRVMIADKLASYSAAKDEVMP